MLALHHRTGWLADVQLAGEGVSHVPARRWLDQTAGT
jgi:hypothetical protein